MFVVGCGGTEQLVDVVQIAERLERPGARNEQRRAVFVVGCGGTEQLVDVVQIAERLERPGARNEQRRAESRKRRRNGVGAALAWSVGLA